MAEEQPSEQPPRGRADHLKRFQFQPGQSGNPRGRPKGRIELHARICKELLKRVESDEIRADVLARKLVDAMEKDPEKMGRFINTMIDRDEGPVDKPQGPLIAIDLTGRVPQAPPLLEAGADGAPTFGEHLQRLFAIAKERGLADLADAHPAEIVAILAKRSAVEELLS